MEGYRGHTGPNVQDFEGCCKLHWNFLKGSCGFWILWTVCRVILRILDLANCFAVVFFGPWILSRAADSGGQEGQPPLLEKSRRGKTIFLPLHLADLARGQLANWSLEIENLVLFTGFLT